MFIESVLNMLIEEASMTCEGRLFLALTTFCENEFFLAILSAWHLKIFVDETFAGINNFALSIRTIPFMILYI